MSLTAIHMYYDFKLENFKENRKPIVL